MTHHLWTILWAIAILREKTRSYEKSIFECVWHNPRHSIYTCCAPHAHALAGLAFLVGSPKGNWKTLYATIHASLYVAEIGKCRSYIWVMVNHAPVCQMKGGQTAATHSRYGKYTNINGWTMSRKVERSWTSWCSSVTVILLINIAASRIVSHILPIPFITKGHVFSEGFYCRPKWRMFGADGVSARICALHIQARNSVISLGTYCVTNPYHHIITASNCLLLSVLALHNIDDPCLIIFGSKSN